MFSRVEPMHEICGVAGMPSARISSTVASVPSRVDPPAPNVTEQNAGFSGASCLRAARSFSTPSGVRGGKNSTLYCGSLAIKTCPHEPLFAASEQQRRQCPRNDAVHDRAEKRG